MKIHQFQEPVDVDLRADFRVNQIMVIMTILLIMTIMTIMIIL